MISWKKFSKLRKKKNKVESCIGLGLVVLAFAMSIIATKLQTQQENSSKDTQISFEKEIDGAVRTGADAQTKQNTQIKNNENITIVVDAGHGGDDPGKIGIHGEKEKEINLNIAKKLKDNLEKQKYTVIMTRESDAGLYDENATSHKVQDLQRRCEKIEEAKGSLLVSIHQNSYPAESVKGAQVFYHGQSNGGKELAEFLQKELVESLDKKNTRQAKSNESYYILKKTSVPAVIVECGFLSNAKEAALLSSDDYQTKVAQAVCHGIQKYIEKDSAQDN